MRIISMAFSLLLASSVFAQDTTTSARPKATPLLQSSITGVDTHEALMTHVNMPANAVLPMHYHPTEEFLYVVAGETILRIKGKADTVVTAGTAAKIPVGEIHTAVTTKAAAEIIVFRVHPKGQPVRTIPSHQK